MVERRDPESGRRAHWSFLVGLGILLFSAGPGSSQGWTTHPLAASVGLAAYEPPLDELRAALSAAGGGALEARTDWRDRSLYLAIARLTRGVTGRCSGFELSSARYVGRAAAGDFRLEIERWAGAFLKLTRQDGKGRLQACYGTGPALFRLRREGQAEERLALQTTRTDWLWGLSTLAGAEILLSPRLALGTRYTYDLVRTTFLDGLEYSLSGDTFAFCLTWYSR
jgi:hypothetical protein